MPQGGSFMGKRKLYVKTNLGTALIVLTPEVTRVRSLQDEIQKQHHRLFPEQGQVSCKRVTTAPPEGEGYGLPGEYTIADLLEDPTCNLLAILDKEQAGGRKLPAAVETAANTETELSLREEPDHSSGASKKQKLPSSANKAQATRSAQAANDATGAHEPSKGAKRKQAESVVVQAASKRPRNVIATCTATPPAPAVSPLRNTRSKATKQFADDDAAASLDSTAQPAKVHSRRTVTNKIASAADEEANEAENQEGGASEVAGTNRQLADSSPQNATEHPSASIPWQSKKGKLEAASSLRVPSAKVSGRRGAASVVSKGTSLKVSEPAPLASARTRTATASKAGGAHGGQELTAKKSLSGGQAKHTSDKGDRLAEPAESSTDDDDTDADEREDQGKPASISTGKHGQGASPSAVGPPADNPLTRSSGAPAKSGSVKLKVGRSDDDKTDAEATLPRAVSQQQVLPVDAGSSSDDDSGSEGEEELAATQHKGVLPAGSSPQLANAAAGPKSNLNLAQAEQPGVSAAEPGVRRAADIIEPHPSDTESSSSDEEPDALPQQQPQEAAAQTAEAAAEMKGSKEPAAAKNKAVEDVEESSDKEESNTDEKPGAGKAEKHSTKAALKARNMETEGSSDSEEGKDDSQGSGESSSDSDSEAEDEDATGKDEAEGAKSIKPEVKPTGTAAKQSAKAVPSISAEDSDAESEESGSEFEPEDNAGPKAEMATGQQDESSGAAVAAKSRDHLAPATTSGQTAAGNTDAMINGRASAADTQAGEASPAAMSAEEEEARRKRNMDLFHRPGFLTKLLRKQSAQILREQGNDVPKDNLDRPATPTPLDSRPSGLNMAAQISKEPEFTQTVQQSARVADEQPIAHDIAAAPVEKPLAGKAAKEAEKVNNRKDKAANGQPSVMEKSATRAGKAAKGSRKAKEAKAAKEPTKSKKRSSKRAAEQPSAQDKPPAEQDSQPAVEKPSAQEKAAKRTGKAAKKSEQLERRNSQSDAQPLGQEECATHSGKAAKEPKKRKGASAEARPIVADLADATAIKVTEEPAQPKKRKSTVSGAVHTVGDIANDGGQDAEDPVQLKKQARTRAGDEPNEANAPDSACAVKRPVVAPETLSVIRQPLKELPTKAKDFQKVIKEAVRCQVKHEHIAAGKKAPRSTYTDTATPVWWPEGMTWDYRQLEGGKGAAEKIYHSMRQYLLGKE